MKYLLVLLCPEHLAPRKTEKTSPLSLVENKAVKAVYLRGVYGASSENNREARPDSPLLERIFVIVTTRGSERPGRHASVTVSRL